MQSRLLGKPRQKKYHWQSPGGGKTDSMLWSRPQENSKTSAVVKCRVRGQGLAVVKIRKTLSPILHGIHCVVFSRHSINITLKMKSRTHSSSD